MVPNIVPGDFLVGFSDLLVAGEVGLAVAVTRSEKAILSVGPAARTMAANPIGTEGSRSPSADTHSGAVIGSLGPAGASRLGTSGNPPAERHSPPAESHP